MLSTGAATYGYLLIPLLSLGMIGALALVLRWMTTPARRAPRPDSTGYGLLVPLVRLDDRAEAARLAHRLRSEGIRASTTAEGSSHQVLVWAVQEGMARALVPRLTDHGPGDPGR